MGKRGLGKFIVGVGIGVGLGFLFAPEKGSETRRILKEKFDDLVDKVKNIDAEDVKLAIETKITEIKEELEDLDKEKVVAFAKKKAERIKKKTEELYLLAKEKATPVVEKAVSDLRDTAIKVTSETLEKLEADKKKK